MKTEKHQGGPGPWILFPEIIHESEGVSPHFLHSNGADLVSIVRTDTKGYVVTCL